MTFSSNANRLWGLGLCVTAVLGLTACPKQQLKPLTPCSVTGTTNRIQVTDVSKVDLVFLVDNSNSMKAEQLELAARIQLLASALASGDTNGDGEQEFKPVNDLHIAVITSDLGTGNANSDPQTCSDLDGDNAAFQTAVNSALLRCDGVSDPPQPFLEFQAEQGLAGADAISSTFGCIVESLGIDGCGFEQQLEAVLKAISPSTSSLVSGLGDTEHAGFLRSDSLLGVILVTDEDDCSASDLELFNPDADQYDIEGFDALNLRCANPPFASALHSINRYSDGLLALVPSPDLLIFGVIAGVPPELDDLPLARLLSEPEMIPRQDPNNSSQLAPSCSRVTNDPENPEQAFPPRRLVETALDVEKKGGNAVVESICQDDLTGAIRAITQRLADVLGASCLERPQTPDAAGLVNCEVLETLPATGEFTTCASLAELGREAEPVRIDDENREVCRLIQLPVDRFVTPPVISEGEGWYYDDFSLDVADSCSDSAPQRISFSLNGRPRVGSNVRLECQARARSSAQGVTAGLDESCTADAACRDDLICDPKTATCQAPCQTDADCSALGSFVCDTRRLEEGFPLVCVNDTCGAQ